MEPPTVTPTDSVEDLPGHVLLSARLSQVLHNAGGPQGDVAVVSVNIDRFRVVNHRFGLDAGDRILVEIARRISGCLRRQDTVARPKDTVARIGADEFSVLLTGISSTEDVLTVVDRVRDAFARPLSVGGEEISVSACYGIAFRGRKGERPEAMLRQASIALHRAKKKGPDSHHIFEAGVDASEERRLRVENELREALSREQLELAWQPVVSLTTGRIESVEALLRWEHPELGPLAPLEFLSVAEESGLILSIGRWVLKQACNRARHWSELDRTEERVRVSVNVSARELQHQAFHRWVQEALEEADLPPECLELEISEGLLMRPSLDLRRLRALGVRLSIDDFGTGNLSFAYLAKLPVSAVKIDGAVVSGLGRDPEASTVAGAMLATARSFQLATIAEGVETAEQVAILKGLGCSHGQGYLFTQPLSSSETEALLRGGEPLSLGGG